MNLKNIVAENENGSFVLYEKSVWYVMLSGITHSISDSSYNDESLALARLKYFSNKSVEDINRIAFNIEMNARH